MQLVILCLLILKLTPAFATTLNDAYGDDSSGCPLGKLRPLSSLGWSRQCLMTQEWQRHFLGYISMIALSMQGILCLHILSFRVDYTDKFCEIAQNLSVFFSLY